MCVLHVKACGMQLGCMCNFVTLQPIFKKEILIWNYLMTR